MRLRDATLVGLAALALSLVGPGVSFAAETVPAEPGPCAPGQVSTTQNPCTAPATQPAGSSSSPAATCPAGATYNSATGRCDQPGAVRLSPSRSTQN
jgi:hypothetical protein